MGGAPWLSNAAQQPLSLQPLAGRAPLHPAPLHPAPHFALCWRTTLRHPQPGQLGQHGHQHLHGKQLRLLPRQHVQVRRFWERLGDGRVTGILWLFSACLFQAK